MNELLEIPECGRQQELRYGPSVLPVSKLDWKTSRPDRHLVLHAPDGLVCARASLWWKRSPCLQGRPSGCIGHFSAADGAVAAKLVNAACSQLAQAGCAEVFAPLDGCTWNSYRLVTERGTEPPFFLEPDNPTSWPGVFTSNGFFSIARYYSSLNTDLLVRNKALERAAARLEDSGIRIRAFEKENAERDLAALYQVSLQSFRNNFLYTPIDWPSFREKYVQLFDIIRPELVLLAECGTDTIGFVFTLPDMCELRRTGSCRTAIVKTVAVLPGRRNGGLGKLLIERSQLAAHEAGFTRVIHALMHESNPSFNLTRDYGNVFRTYELFGRQLRP